MHLSLQSDCSPCFSFSLVTDSTKPRTRRTCSKLGLVGDSDSEAAADSAGSSEAGAEFADEEVENREILAPCQEASGLFAPILALGSVGGALVSWNLGGDCETPNLGAGWLM